MNPAITIAVQCHNFQRRLCWKLSSLAQQTTPGLFVVDVAFMPMNGSPTTEDVCSFFNTIQIKRSLWTDYEAFQKRGFVRNRQLAECQTEWILFADADMIYHREFFQRVTAELAVRHANATYLIGSGRRTTTIEQATSLVNTVAGPAPVMVDNAFEKAFAIRTEKQWKAIGAGNNQIANVKHGAHGGYYVDPNDNPDWGWGPKGQNTKSDIRFRKRMNPGGQLQALPEWFDKSVIHLNHNRDKDAGAHVTEQR